MLCILFNAILLVDLILAMVFYGPRTLLKIKNEYVWEIILQVMFFVCTIWYYSYNKN